MYAVAQGPLAIGGFAASGQSGSSVTRGVPTARRIASGALVEREIPRTTSPRGKAAAGAAQSISPPRSASPPPSTPPSAASGAPPIRHRRAAAAANSPATWSRWSAGSRTSKSKSIALPHRH
ncbi:MAG: flagellar basal body P-ring protein FlgI [Hyphomonadaceae bacterium]